MALDIRTESHFQIGKSIIGTPRLFQFTDSGQNGTLRDRNISHAAMQRAKCPSIVVIWGVERSRIFQSQ